jgi:hypothetical protein
MPAAYLLPWSDGIIDAESVKTQYASEERGIDGGKKVKDRKRHILVDFSVIYSMSKIMSLISVTPKVHAMFLKGGR